MSSSRSLPFRVPLGDYQREADELFAALQAGVSDAAWRFKWEHPRFKGKSIDDVRAAGLGPADAQLVVAQQHSFHTWSDLAEFARAVQSEGPIAQFETAVEAVIAGDLATLRAMLSEHPELSRARSVRRHHATLLHYIAANGVEGERQKTPPDAVEVAELLLAAGAEVDALADMYDNRCTTLSMLVSSSPPHAAGLQAALAETLLDHGAAHVGPGSNWQSALTTALAFGFGDTARTLARRGAPIESVAAAAGLGRLDDARRLLPSANPRERQVALALAAQHGHAEVVRMLLDAGADPNRYNPDGFHSHSTPLHQAVWSDSIEVVKLLVERGARTDMRDKVYQGSALGWALYGKRAAIADYLRSRGAVD